MESTQAKRDARKNGILCPAMRNKAILFAAAALFVAGAFAEKQPIERYQSIIDRMPFGQPPPGFDPTRNPDEVSRSDLANAEQELTQEQEAIQKAVQFSVINVEADGTVRVGFSDCSDAKSPRHFYMAVGEERGGWLVREADPKAKTMTVVKDDVEVMLHLGDSSGKGAEGKGSRARGETRATTSAERRSAILSRAAADASGEAYDPAATGLPEGRRARREREERERAAFAARLEEESKRKAEEEAARREEDQAAREAERAEQREQLNAIRDELRMAREESKKKFADKDDSDDDGDSGDSDDSNSSNDEGDDEDE